MAAQINTNDDMISAINVVPLVDQARKSGISKYVFNADSEAAAGVSATTIENSEHQPDKKSEASLILNPKS